MKHELDIYKILEELEESIPLCLNEFAGIEDLELS